MDSRPPNSTLLVAFVKFDKFDHDFYTFFALILHDLALSVMWFSTKKKDQLIITRTHDLSRDEILSYQKDGILIMREQLFSSQKLEEITKVLLDQVESLGANSPKLIHSHLWNQSILDIAKEPGVVRIAGQLLKTDDVNIFTTRILCKMPKIGQSIPWHQENHMHVWLDYPKFLKRNRNSNEFKF